MNSYTVPMNDNKSQHPLTMANVSLEKRRELCATRVTLNGFPATVSGARMKFAVVRQLGGGLERVEYAWETVQRIVEHKNGEFRS